jgi:hypothetical protein
MPSEEFRVKCAERAAAAAAFDQAVLHADKEARAAANRANTP